MFRNIRSLFTNHLFQLEVINQVFHKREQEQYQQREGAGEPWFNISMPVVNVRREWGGDWKIVCAIRYPQSVHYSIKGS